MCPPCKAVKRVQRHIIQVTESQIAEARQLVKQRAKSLSEKLAAQNVEIIPRSKKPISDDDWLIESRQRLDQVHRLAQNYLARLQDNPTAQTLDELLSQIPEERSEKESIKQRAKKTELS